MTIPNIPGYSWFITRNTPFCHSCHNCQHHRAHRLKSLLSHRSERNIPVIPVLFPLILSSTQDPKREGIPGLTPLRTWGAFYPWGPWKSDHEARSIPEVHGREATTRRVLSLRSIGREATTRRVLPWYHGGWVGILPVHTTRVGREIPSLLHICLPHPPGYTWLTTDLSTDLSTVDRDAGLPR